MPEFNDYEYDRVRACVKHLYSRENTVTGEDIQEGMCAIMRVDAEKEKEKKALGIGAHIRLLEDALAVNDNPDAWDHGAVIGLLKAVRDGTERIFDQELQNFPWPTGITAQKVKKIKELVCDDPVERKHPECPNQGVAGSPSVENQALVSEVPAMKDKTVETTTEQVPDIKATEAYLDLFIEAFAGFELVPMTGSNAPAPTLLSESSAPKILTKIKDGIAQIFEQEQQRKVEDKCAFSVNRALRNAQKRIVGEQKERL